MSNSFTIYNASAGSGKTFTLVKEYLVLLFKANRKDAYKNILAITFTNKAVEEMKTRIVKSLNEFSQAVLPKNAVALMQAVSTETSLTEEEIKAKAKIILKSIIHNYAAFEVSTIDGFTHRVLRTFAKDLGLPVNFEVELNTKQILLEAVESLINKAGTDKKLTRILVDFALSKTDDDKSWDITRDLLDISELLINENNHKALHLLKDKNLLDFGNFKQKLKQEILVTENILKEVSTSFFEILESNQLNQSNFKGKYVPKYFEKIQNKAPITFGAKWMENLASDALYTKTLDPSKKEILDNLQQEIVTYFEISKRAYYNLEFLKEIQKKQVQLSLLSSISKEIEEIKKERSLVLISEFNPRISAEVKNQPAPFIYERLGERYQNYFIDEFQDTSQMQWENLIPLIDHNLTGMDQSSEDAALMLVGDAKQSIYRWRGGKAEQFIDLYLDANPFNIDKKVENLPSNFRSGAEIVNFNNAFFKFASAQLNNPDYKHLFEQSHQIPKKENFGYVDIQFIDAENKDEELELYPQKVLEIIQNLENKGFPKSDICILTRRKFEGINIANHLSDHGISVVSSETLLISNAPEVNFMVAIMKFSIHPENDELKLEIFRFLEEKFTITEPHQVISSNLAFHGKDFFTWLELFNIEFDLTALKSLSLYESAEYIIRSFHLIEDSNAYIQFFLDYLFEATQRSTTGIQGFLELWDQDKEKLSIIVPKEENAVQIMTIHTSKGLEFPIVIYPFANADFQDTKRDSLWVELNEPLNDIPVSYLSASKKMLNWGDYPTSLYEELMHQKELDTLNILYVACTRASNQLYILSKLELDSKTGNEKLNKTSGLLIGFLKEQNVWSDSTHYTFGEIPQVEYKEAKTSKSRYHQKFYSNSTQNQAVNIVTRAGSLWDTKQEEAIEKGHIVHDILANIDTFKDVEREVTKAIDDGLIPVEAQTSIKELLVEITTHPDLSKYFEVDAKNYNERDILLDDGLRLRPDRLNFNGNKVSIIDYKTGDYSDSHPMQLNSYAQILTSMGYEIEALLLVYINKGVAVKHV